MIYTNLRMPVPQGPRYETITVHGNPYLYYRTESKRINGKLKHFRQSLGRTVSEDGELWLIPNENYFTHMGLPQPVGEEIKTPGRQKKKSQECACNEATEHGTSGSGYAIACHKISRELGLWDDLADVFGEDRARDMLGIAAYMAKGAPGGMSGLEYFIQKQMLFTDTVLDSQKLNSIYQEIIAAERFDFFSFWVRRHGRNNTACYDVNTHASCSENIRTAVYGCNLGFERLAQVSLGLFCSVPDGLPLCYAEYNGSITDFTNLSCVIKSAKKQGINDKFLTITDGSFAVQSDTDLTALHGYNVLMGAPVCFYNSVRILLLDWRQSSKSEENIIEYNDELFRASETNSVFGETEARVLMYKSSSKNSDDECSLARLKRISNESIAKQQEKMSVDAAKKYEPFFDIDIKENGSFEQNFNETAYREAVSLCGCFALLCTKEELSLYDALNLYQGKAEIEKAFGMLKNDVLQERLHAVRPGSLQGKMFLAFLGLILRRFFDHKLHQWLLQEGLSLDVALEMLCDTECREGKSGWFLTKAFTGQQKELIKILDLPVNYPCQK